MKETAVSRNIKNFRDQKGWSQQQLADELNRSRGTISKWETDKETPNMEALIQLSSIFEVSIDYLVGPISRKHTSRNSIVFINFRKPMTNY